jgi:hypothetical protein
MRMRSVVKIEFGPAIFIERLSILDAVRAGAGCRLLLGRGVNRQSNDCAVFPDS